MVDKDEHPRPESTEEKLAGLGALFDNGVVTAGNASGLNDGAAALIVGTLAAGERAGIAPAPVSWPAPWRALPLG